MANRLYNKIIIGCIIFKTKKAKYCYIKNESSWFSKHHPDKRAILIMTIGVFVCWYFRWSGSSGSMGLDKCWFSLFKI